MLARSPEPEAHDDVIQIELELEMLVFEERGKPEYPMYTVCFCQSGKLEPTCESVWRLKNERSNNNNNKMDSYGTIRASASVS